MGLGMICDVCGREIGTIGSYPMYGLLWTLLGDNPKARSDMAKYYPEITKDKYVVCIVCFLRALGVKL